MFFPALKSAGLALTALLFAGCAATGHRCGHCLELSLTPHDDDTFGYAFQLHCDALGGDGLCSSGQGDRLPLGRPVLLDGSNIASSSCGNWMLQHPGNELTVTLTPVEPAPFLLDCTCLEGVGCSQSLTRHNLPACTALTAGETPKQLNVHVRWRQLAVGGAPADLILEFDRVIGWGGRLSAAIDTACQPLPEEPQASASAETAAQPQQTGETR